MVVKAVYSISILSSITFCLLDIVFLGIEKLPNSIYSLYTALYICIGYFEIFLPG
jgi:hypothetical protein